MEITRYELAPPNMLSPLLSTVVCEGHYEVYLRGLLVSYHWIKDD